LNLEINFILVT